ncbi:hypothetical protein B0H99_10749 [Planomicrobium soli]|uniref:Sigma-70-like protein n=1 Tax=Planomicrobium soli TaxID=1176648 RepID=A0A2P8GQI0_9BACL|nr:hypothetical protein [Planomicrobium soli]PSL36228.1 hypothetical protein B0H99_10749 [Planomicrobium soli]
MYDLYVLCNHGISLNVVRILNRDGFSLNDFFNYSDTVIILGHRKPKLVNDIKNILPLLTEKEIKNNLYQLTHEGLTERVIQNMIGLNISYEDLSGLTAERFIEMKEGNREKTFQKIMKSYETVEKNKGRTPFSEIRDYVNQFLSKFSIDELISFENLQEIIKREFKLEGDELKATVEALLQVEWIHQCESGIRKKYPTLSDYLKGDFKDKEVFMGRLEGKTLYELSVEYGYSRQGIRNIEIRVIKKMPEFEEDKRYSMIFKKYNMDLDLFCKLFNEPLETYNYLSCKYQKGNQSVLSDVTASIFNKTQQKLILRQYDSYLNKEGVVEGISKSTIFNEVIYEYAVNPVTDTEIFPKYNAYIEEHNLPLPLLVNPESIRGLSDRCQLLLKGKGNTYRYYDYDLIDENVLSTLKSIIPLEDGIYSMRKLFKENPEIMVEIDIKTEYELHNLYRRLIQSDELIYTRMPEFSIGEIDKSKFLLKLIHEQAPIHIRDFAEYVEEVYGLRQDSLTSYIISNLNEYIHDNVLKVDYMLLGSKELECLKSLMAKSIYTVDEVERIGQSIDKDFGEKFLNNMNLFKVEYSLRGNYVLKSEYGSVERYFIEMISSLDYFIKRKLPIYESSVFKKVIYDAEKDFRLVKIEEDMYITEKKLAEAGITKTDFLNFRDFLSEFINGKSYFTLHSLKKAGFSHYLEELGFSEIFYERIVWSFNGINSIRTASGYIFKFTDEIITLRMFLAEQVKKMEVISVDKLQEYLKDEFGIEMEEYKLLYLLRETGIFYSEELRKLYLNKENFYEEVF